MHTIKEHLELRILDIAPNEVTDLVSLAVGKIKDNKTQWMITGGSGALCAEPINVVGDESLMVLVEHVAIHHRFDKSDGAVLRFFGACVLSFIAKFCGYLFDFGPIRFWLRRLYCLR